MNPSTALWYETKQKLTLRTQLLCPATKGELQLSGLYSGVSRGTERLVFEGKIPKSEWANMQCPHQAGTFDFPVKYGYGYVGRIMGDAGQDSGKSVFALHPHQSQANVPSEMCYLLPEDVPARRAVLSANMETALNVIWDSGISAGDRVLVIGAGVVGLLIAWLASGFPGAEVSICDVDAGKRAVASELGLMAIEPDLAVDGYDVSINASASGGGLQTALRVTGFEGRIVEASWFGDEAVSLPLGQAFHSRRLQLISSQVGQVPPSRRGKWSYRRRMEKAISLLRAPVLDKLITHEIDFMAAPDELPPLFNDPSALGIVLRYPDTVSTET